MFFLSPVNCKYFLFISLLLSAVNKKHVNQIYFFYFLSKSIFYSINFYLKFYHHQTFVYVFFPVCICIDLISCYIPLKCLFISCVIAFFVEVYFFSKKIYDDGWHLRGNGWETLFVDFLSFALHRQPEKNSFAF